MTGARPQTSGPSAEAPLVSVVICTHNGERILRTSLAAVTGQRLENGTFEVILVDDASTDESGAIAEKAGVRVVRRERSSGLAAARNAGMAEAQGDYLVFTDDDCEPEPGWLQELIRPLSDPRVDGVSGYTTTASTETVALRYLELRNPLRPLPESLLRTTSPWARLRNYLLTETGASPSMEAGARLYNLVGANMAVRRELAEAVGGFDETFVQSEDEDFCLRVHRRLGGAVFVYQPSARVRHHYRPNFGDSLRRARIYGHGNALTSIAQKRLPIVYPFPVLVAGALLYAIARRPRMLPLVPFAPLGCYVRWLPIIRISRPETVLYPYMQLLQECSFMYAEAAYFASRLA